MADPLIPPDPWQRLRRLTPARIALGRAGASLSTGAVLGFALDHALARDAVHAPFDSTSLAAKLAPLHSPVLELASAASARATYLQRPDLGRRLAPESAALLSESATAAPPCDLVIVISDGLSALAVERQAPAVVAALLPTLKAAGVRLGPLCVVRLGRVAIQDEIGELLGSSQSLILLGERPGLGTPDSLGAYLTYAPRRGRTDAERNCVSNIHAAGLPPTQAASRIAALLLESRRLRLSGVQLKERGDPPRLL